MKTKGWVLEYIVHNEQINPLMGWQSSSNTLSEVKMTFSSKEDAIDYAKKNKIKQECFLNQGQQNGLYPEAK